MIQINKNVWVENDDREVLAYIDQLKKSGVKLPDFDETAARDQFIFAVSYDGVFNLHIIMYSPKEGDSGYTVLRIGNFLTTNKFNLKQWEWWGFDIAEALTSIHLQVSSIAERINYPLAIMTVFKNDFIGLAAEAMVDAN